MNPYESPSHGPEPAICAKCQHFLTKDRGRVWYQQFCGASPSPQKLNYQTGELEHEFGNPFKYASHVNPDGKCELFEPKVPAYRRVVQLFSSRSQSDE